MTRRQAVISTASIFIVGGLVGSMLWAQGKQGPPPEKLLPAGALLYVGWDGTDAHRDTWNKTAAYEALVQSGLADVVTKLADWAQRQTGEEPVRMVMGSLSHISHKGLHLAVAVPVGEQGPPLPQLTVVVPEAGGAVKDIATLIERTGIPDFHQQQAEGRQVTRGRLPNLPAVEVGWWAEGSHLVIAAGVGAVDAALQVAAGKAPDLSTNAVWKKHKSKADFDVALVSWIDLKTIREFVGEFPVPGPNGQQPAQVKDILQTLGLNNIGPLACRFGFKDRSLWTETTLEAPGPRSGLLAFGEQKTISLTDLPALPAGTDGFYAGRFDWSQAASGLLKISEAFLKQFGPPDAPSAEQLLAQLKQQLGVDLQRDLFDPLGDVMVVYGDNRQGLFGLGLGLAISVDDAGKLRTTVDRLLARLGEAAGSDVRIKAVARGARTVNLIEIPQFPLVSPSLVVEDKWIVVGLYPQTVDAYLLRQDGKLPKWIVPDGVTEALKELPSKYTSLTFSDPREGLRSALGLAPTMISFAHMGFVQSRRQPGMNVNFEPPVSAADFPPAEFVTRSLFPNVSVCTVNDQEIRWTSRSSLPAIPLMGGAGIGSGAAATPVLVALLLPAVQQAREAARRTQSRNNLKQIGLALHNYHDAFNGFPAGTHPNDKLKAEKRLSWMADILPYIDQAPLYNQIDFKKGWEDQANAEAIKARVPVYLNPGVAAPGDPKFGTTHYVGIAGLGKDAATLPIGDKRAGVFGYNRITRIQNIIDGTSNTMGVAEASKDYGAWGGGGPSTIRGLTTKPYINGPDGIGGPYRGGLHVLMMDGSVRFVSENIDPTTFEALSTIGGREVIPNF